MTLHVTQITGPRSFWILVLGGKSIQKPCAFAMDSKTSRHKDHGLILAVPWQNVLSASTLSMMEVCTVEPMGTFSNHSNMLNCGFVVLGYPTRIFGVTLVGPPDACEGADASI